MASSAIEQLRAERRAQREQAGYDIPSENEPQPSLAVSQNEATRQLANTSFGNRVADDVSGLAYGVPAAAATILTQSPIKTAKMIGSGLLQTGKDMLGVTGILGKKQQDESLTYYKAHPVLALLDIASIVTLGAGTVLKSALTSTARSAATTAVRVAAVEGVEASLVTRALQTSRSMFNVNKYVRGTTKANTTFMREIEKVVRTGETGGVQETVRALLVKGGVEETKALSIAGKVAKDVADNLITQGKRVKILDGLTHPVAASFRGAKGVVGGAAGKLLGKGTDSAVGQVFEAPLLEANKKTATNLERWLGAVANERGWEQTADNRLRILREIKEQGEFQGLSQEQFLKDFDNYVQADTSRAKLGLENEYVLVKNLPVETAESMADTIKENLPRIRDEIIDAATEGTKDAATVTVRVYDALNDFMTEHYGNAWTKYSDTVRKSFGKTGNLNALESAVRNLSKQKPTLVMKKLNDAQQALISDIEKFGYQVGYAPANKVISQAADIAGDAAKTADNTVPAVRVAEDVTKTADNIGWETIQSTRNFLGAALDKMGFSTKGTIEGASEFAFSQNYTQHLMGTFREKFGNRITIAKPVVREGRELGTTRISIPTDRLYEWLRNHRNEMFQNRTITEGRLAPLRIISVFDINEKDLIGMGFEKTMAKELVDTAQKSLREVPASVVGMGEKAVNLMRTADVGFAKFGSWYDAMLKTAFYTRYQSAAAVLFQAQQYIETKIMSSMIAKDLRLLPGAEGLVGFGKRMTPKKVQGMLEGMTGLNKRLLIQPDLEDFAIAQDVLLPNVRRSLQDTIGGAEFGAIRNSANGGVEGTVAKKLRRTTQNKSEVLSIERVDAFWLQAWGGTAMRQSAKLGSAIAEKFNMTLKEATEFTVENGQRIYKYPRIVREMQDSVQQVLHYRPGFQTSPLVKTLNIALFPFRFQAKTLEVTAKWLGSLEPMQRLVVVNQLSQFSNWVQTDEGKEFINSNKDGLTWKRFSYLMGAYTTAWEQIGDGVNAASRGELFGGNAGLIGGIPLGFVMNFARATGLVAQDPQTIDPATGRPFRGKEVPRELMSSETAVTAVEEALFMMLPGMPMYTLTGGVLKGFSWRAVAQGAIDKVRDAVEGGGTQRGAERAKRERERNLRTIRPGETRF